MNDEEIIKLLQLTVARENVAELNDQAVDEFLSQAKECPAERTDRVRKRYIEKILEELNPLPVRKIENKTTFGRWLEAARRSVHLSCADVAAALFQEPVFMEKVERGDVLPWECKPELIAEMMNLFRVHMEGVTKLISASAAVSQVRGIGPVAARARGGKPSKDRGESASRALDLFLAHNTEHQEKPDDAVLLWTEKLRRALRERKFDYLTDSVEEAR